VGPVDDNGYQWLSVACFEGRFSQAILVDLFIKFPSIILRARQGDRSNGAGCYEVDYLRCTDVSGRGLVECFY